MKDIIKCVSFLIIVLLFLFSCSGDNFSEPPNFIWEKRTTSLQSWSVCNDLEVANDGTIIFTPTANNRPICISTDFGNAWLSRLTPEERNANDAAVFDKHNIWFCTGTGKIYYSNNIGETWQLQYSDDINEPYFNYIHFFDRNRGVAMADRPAEGMPALILRTNDGGNTWISVNTSYLIDEWSGDDFYRIDFPSLETGYFYGSNGHKLYKTSDGGITWRDLAPSFLSGSMYTFKFYDNNLGIAQSSGGMIDYLYRTKDGGRSWIKLDLGTNSSHHDIEFLPGNPSNVWFTDYNNLFFSSDTGNTWQEVDIGLSDLRARNIEFSDNNKGVILCDHKNLFITLNNGGM